MIKIRESPVTGYYHFRQMYCHFAQHCIFLKCKILVMKLKYNFYAQCIINYLLQKGVKASEVHRVTGIPKTVNDPMEHELSIENIHDLTLYFRNKLGIEHVGLEITQYLNFQNSGFFGSYALSCPTLKDAIFRVYTVHKEVNSLFTYEMKPADKPSRFVYSLDKLWEARYPESAKEIVEFVIANGVSFSRQLTKQDIIPVSIEFKHDVPGNISLYKDIFRCPVKFNRDANVAAYSSAIMDYEIPTYNPTLLEILDDFAKKTIQQNAFENNIVSTVRTLIIKSAHTVIPHEEEIAFQLNISKRTLQAKLKEGGTSFKQILEGVQKELALAYLKSGTTSNKEIAWLLGYNDISNFYRAFRRWTGVTPNEFKGR